ncbi:MAG TPA: translocation/assembly module TamB domain-containing protein [Steroidobacteraceae bacterium]
MRKWIIICVVAALLVLPIALLGVLLYTQTGVGLIASQLDRLERFGVHIEGLSGTLAGPLHIKRFELDNSHVHIVTLDIVAQLELRKLLLQTVTLSSLTTRDTLIEIRNPPPTPDNGQPLRFLPGFMRVDAHGAQFTRIRYVNIDGTTVDMNSLHGRVSISPQEVRADEFRIDASEFNLAGNGRLRAQKPLALELNATGNAHMERGTQIAAAAQLGGTLDELTIKVNLQQPDVAKADVVLTRPEGHWRIAGTVAAEQFSLEPWMDRPPLSLRNVTVKVDAQPDSIRVAGNVGIPEFDTRDLTIDARGRFAAKVLHLDTADIALNDSPARMHVSGDLTFGSATPAIDIAARWQNLQWPLHGDSDLHSASGDATLRGPLPYDYTINAQFRVPRVGNGSGSASGVLSKEAVSIASYSVKALGGAASGTGSLQFKQPQAWTLSAAATDINPAAIDAQFPGRVRFNVTAKGQGLSKDARFDARLAQLAGTLRNEPLQGSGIVQRDAHNWRVQNAKVSLGKMQLVADGTLGERVDAHWSLQADSLQTLLPQARGKVDFTGSANGPVKTPHVVATLRASDLGYNQWRVGVLNISGDVDLAGTAPSRWSFQARNAGNDQPLIDMLRLTGEGNATEHRVTIAMRGNAAATPGDTSPRARVQVVGHLIQGVWSAVITGTNVDPGVTEKLSIVAPANLVVAQDHASLDDLCLSLGNGRFCVNGKWQRNGPWEGTVAGYEIPLAALLPPGGDQGEYSGRIEGRVKASGLPGQPWQGEAGMRIIDAAIIYRPQGAEPETLNLGNGGLAATATSQSVDFSLGLQAFADTFVYANAHIDRHGSNDLLHLPLTGDVKARAADANILPIMFPEVDNAAGVLTANINVHGMLAAPEIDGRIELNNGEFDSYRVNLALRELNLAADLASTGLQFKGTGRAGDGQLDVGGHLSWHEGVSRGQLTLKGQNLLVADLPEYRVVASPDLKFEIDGQQMKASGELNIPSASIKPVNLSGAVQPSQDARYVGETVAEREGRFVVDSDIRVVIGDDVQIDSFGLQGHVKGGVQTLVHTGDTAIGRGELSIAEGRYEAYGQKLDISRGRLLFDSSPLDDPGLDIEARRTVDSVEVGMNVRGTLRSPRLTFFSDPAMPQTQIVSYLLVGKGIDDMQSGETATVNSARDTLALQGGGVLASQLGHRLGLEEVGVESTTQTSGQTNTALVLGKFLSPRLFISYGISLTESINTLKLRYTLSDRWVLKLEAGEAQAADAEFRIQR